MVIPLWPEIGLFKKHSERRSWFASRNIGVFMIKKNLLIDASILLHDPEVFFHLPNTSILIPSVVLEELDKKKTQTDEAGRHARSVMRFVDNVSKEGNIRSGVSLPNGGSLKVLLDFDDQKHFPSISAADKNRHRLLSMAYHLNHIGEKPCLLSKDPVTKIMAETIGIQTANYKGSKEYYDSIYRGINFLNLSKAEIDQFYLSGEMPIPQGEYNPNEYFVCKSEENSSAICRMDFRKKCLVPLSHKINDVWGIKPRNVEQKCAMDLLMRDDVKLITFIGPAGTGKTLLALAAGLRKVFDEGVYNKIIVTKAIMPVGRDIGFLPGTKEEKLRAWLAPFFDNLEFICGDKNNETGNETKKWIIDSEKFQVEAITYMRGRSLSNSFVIIDEAQNLTAMELKTIISRVGENTKIIVLGDASQIDNPYLDMDSNGLVHLLGKMKHYDLCGSIFFRQTERSKLAALAATVL